MSERRRWIVKALPNDLAETPDKASTRTVEADNELQAVAQAAIELEGSMWWPWDPNEVAWSVTEMESAEAPVIGLVD